MRRAWILAPLLACAPADVAVVAADVVGPLPHPPGVVGRDGGVSGAFRGRSVWVYGDTVVDEEGTFPTTWRNNTMAWTEDLDASDGLDGWSQPLDDLGVPREFFPRTAEEDAFTERHRDRGDGACVAPCGARLAVWGGGPLGGVPDDAPAWLPYGLIHGEPGPWNFHVIGTSLARWHDPDEVPLRPVVDGPLPEHPTLLFDADRDGEFGVGGQVVDGHLHLFSCAGGRAGPAHACRLGRAPVARALERAAWTFRARRGWSADVRDAVALFDGSPNLTVHWSPHLDRWLAVWTSWGVVRLRTAPALDGPWSAAVAAFRAPEAGAMHAHGHAELQQEDGAVEFVSYLTDDGFVLLRLELERR